MKTITTFVIRAIAFCIRYPRWVVAAAILIAVVSTWYAATHFTMTTDINQLLSGNSPSRQRELAFEKAFPQFDTIIAVVDAPTPELVQAATGALAAQLSQEKDLFRSIEEPQGGSFFGQNGLLFVPTEQLGQQTQDADVRRSGSFKCWRLIPVCVVLSAHCSSGFLACKAASSNSMRCNGR